MKRLKEIGVRSAARFYAALLGLVALAFGIAFSIFTLLGALMSGGDMIKVLGAALAFVVLFPLLYALLGLIFGAIFAWLYNITASRIGGIEINIE